MMKSTWRSSGFARGSMWRGVVGSGWGFGVILWFVSEILVPTTSFAQNSSETSSGCSNRGGREWTVGNATDCFLRHSALGGLLHDGGMGRVRMNVERDGDDVVVMRELEIGQGAYAVAFFPENQACVLILGEEAVERFDRDESWLLNLIDREAREFIGESADDDCWIEVHSAQNVDVAVIEFLGASGGGLVLGRQDGELRVLTTRVLTITRIGRGDADAGVRSRSLMDGNVVVRWSDRNLLSLLGQYGAQGGEVLRLEENGFVIEFPVDSRVLVLVQPEVREFEICTRQELARRPSRSEAFKDLLQLDDREIAIRAFPGSRERRRRSTVDVAAYALCRGR